MSLVPVSRQESPPAQESNESIVLPLNTQVTLLSCLISSPRNMMNGISENPSWSPLSCPAHISQLSLTVTLNAQFTFLLPQEYALFRYNRHERLIAIVRPVLKHSGKTMDNSEGKCARYKVKPRPFAHWSNEITALSRVMNECARRRVAVAPNDNSEGKSSRFKGLAIVRVQTSSAHSLEYTIVCILLLPSTLISLSRHKNTMTQPVSPGIQCPCFLPLDPPHRCSTPSKSNTPPPPSTPVNLSPFNILSPPLHISTLLSRHEMQMLPPSNVTLPLPPNNDPLPLPTMLIYTTFIPLPPSSSAIPHSLPPPHITRHRITRQSIGLEAHHFPQQSECAQSICR